MTGIKNRIFIFLLATIFLVAIAFDVYKGAINYSIIPIAFLICFLLMQYPKYLLYVLIITIPWSVEYHFGGNLSTDFPDEPLMLLASGTAIILFIYNRKKIDYKNLHPLLIVIALQFIWMIIAAAASTDFLLSLKYSLAKTWYLLAFVALPLFLFKNEINIKRVSVLIVASMITAMFVALVRQFGHDWSFKKVNEALTPFFHNHVIYSALLVFTVPLQIAIVQLSRSFKMKVMVNCLLVTTIAALYFSYSRGSWVALIAGIVTYWLLRKRILVFTFLFFIFLSVAAVFWLQKNNRYLRFRSDYKTTIFHTDFDEHLIATYKLKDLSNAERIYRWVAAFQMVNDYWKTGTGPTTFYEQYKSYTVPAFKTYVSDNKEHSTVHNYFLLLLIEQGIAGMLLFICLLAFVFWYAQKVYCQANEKFWKVVAATVASVIAMECTVNFLSDMIELDKVGSMFYLCVAAIVVADIKTGRGKSNFSANVKSIS